MYTYDVLFGPELLAVQSNYRKASDFAMQILIAGFPVTMNRRLKRVPDQIVHGDVNGTISYLRQSRIGRYYDIFDYQFD